MTCPWSHSSLEFQGFRGSLYQLALRFHTGRDFWAKADGSVRGHEVIQSRSLSFPMVAPFLQSSLNEATCSARGGTGGGSVVACSCGSGDLNLLGVPL